MRRNAKDRAARHARMTSEWREVWSRPKPLCGVITPSQRQMLLGTLLGDGSVLRRPGGINAYYSIAHGIKQEDYCRLKAEVLKNFVRSMPRLIEDKMGRKHKCRFSTVAHTEFTLLRAMCYPYCHERKKEVKTVSMEWLNQLDWEGIAWWYQDDGHLRVDNSNVFLHTEGFTQDEVELIARWFTDSKGIEAKARRYRQLYKGEYRYYCLVQIVDKHAIKFLEKVRPYIHQSMAYKLGDESKKEAYRLKRSEYNRKRWANITPEQREHWNEVRRQRHAANREHFNEVSRQRHAAKTESDKLRLKEYHRKWWAARTPEQRKHVNEVSRQRHAANREQRNAAVRRRRAAKRAKENTDAN